MDELTVALALRLVPGIREEHRRCLTGTGIDATSIAKLSPTELSSMGWPRSVSLRFLHACTRPTSLPELGALLDRIHRLEFAAITWTSAQYPHGLKDVLSDPPPVLFMRGDPALLHRPQLAIVGSRRPNPATGRLVYHWSKELAARGVVITSGLAYGIDVAAHRGAMAAPSGQTIAVMAGGLDHVYPAPHNAVAEAIVDSGGLVLTEQLPDLKPRAGHFPRRNRLVAGLARATLVGQAAKPSGSLITAGIALDQGKPVLVVPDHPSNGEAHGGLQLIRDGAEPAVEWRDCLDHFPECITAQSTGSDSAVAEQPELPEPLQQILRELSTVAEPIESLSQRLSLSATDLLPRLLQLELLGVVGRHRGGFQRLQR